MEAAGPVHAPVTKFGGQPVWRDGPTWPLSRSTRSPMRFIAQVALHDLGGPEGAMAYLFMTELFPEDPEGYVDGTWEPEGGENAVILQPGDAPPVETIPQRTGPTLFRMVPSPDQRGRVPEPCEYVVALERGEAPEVLSHEEAEAVLADETAVAAHFEGLAGNKLGGTPGFLQAEEFPLGRDAHLVLQLDSTTVPFSVNLGDAGVGYVFASGDWRQGRFLWQCA